MECICVLVLDDKRAVPVYACTYDKVHRGPLLPKKEGLHPNDEYWVAIVTCHKSGIRRASRLDCELSLTPEI